MGRAPETRCIGLHLFCATPALLYSLRCWAMTQHSCGHCAVWIVCDVQGVNLSVLLTIC